MDYEMIMSKDSVQAVKNEGLDVKVGGYCVVEWSLVESFRFVSWLNFHVIQVGVSAGYSGVGVSAHASVKVGVNKQTAAKSAVEKEQKDVKVGEADAWSIFFEGYCRSFMNLCGIYLLFSCTCLVDFPLNLTLRNHLHSVNG